MSFDISNPLYPRPASNGTAFITSQTTTITASATTVTGYNLVAPNAVQLVALDVQGDDVRVFWEGTTPTSTAGHILPGATAYTWSAVQYNNAKFILASSSTASVIVASPFTAG